MPKAIFIAGKGQNKDGSAVLVCSVNTIYVSGYSQFAIFDFAEVNWNGNSVSWHTDGTAAALQANSEGSTYYTFGIG